MSITPIPGALCASSRWSNASGAIQLQEQARELALLIGTTMKDACRLERLIATALHQPALASQNQWISYSLAQGYAGVALMYAHFVRCFPEGGWEIAAATYFELALSGMVLANDVPIGTMTGLAGLLFVGRYIEESLGISLPANDQIEARLCAVAARRAGDLMASDGVAVSDIDLISGLSGVLVVLQTYPTGISMHARKLVTDLMVELSNDVDGLPRFRCRSTQADPRDSIAKQFPEGFVNYGLAHGLPGPLCALSLSLGSEPREDVENAVTRLANRLYSARNRDSFGANWPAAVSVLDHQHVGTSAWHERAISTRTAWCYGNPGVSRALHHAAAALNSNELHEAACSAIDAALRRSNTTLDSPTICHGMAGLSQIVMHFASEGKRPSYAGEAVACVTKLISLQDTKSPLRFPSVELKEYRVDHPGLLDGAAGVALTLLSFSESVQPKWDRVFCIG